MGHHHVFGGPLGAIPGLSFCILHGSNGPIILLGTIHSSNCLAVRYTAAGHCGLLVRLLGNLTGLVVSNVRIECHGQHETGIHELIDAVAVYLNVFDGAFDKGDTGVTDGTRGLQYVGHQEGFEHVEPCVPPMMTAVWLSMTCAQTIVMALHWVRLTFPGMIDEPVSLAGSESSPRPHRGPLASKRMSLATLLRLQAMLLRAPETSTSESWAASASNLFGAVTKGMPEALAMRSAMVTS